MLDLTKSNDDVLVIPLGGTDRVGMNATLIGHRGRFILVDLGATFLPADRITDLDVERLVPDLGLVAPLIARVEAIAITHAHQDHIGALTTLLADAASPLAEVPVYATEFTAAMIRRAYDEATFRPRIRRVHRYDPVDVGPFQVRWIPVSHSIPDTSVLAIDTDLGTVVVGTDIKDDPDPILGYPTDFEALEKIGIRGVLAFLGDSTNAHRTGTSRSEGEVLQSLTDLMDRHPGRVIVSTFSSNVARVASAQAAAAQTGRSLGLLGRSLVKTVEIALETGELDRSTRLFTWREMELCPDRNSAVVCTGTQAEQNSALRDMVARLGTGRPGLRPTDMFVHAARTIPGNEIAVNDMLEAMRRAGLTVVTAEEGVHASGHGHRDELRKFYRALRPRYAIPVHGSRDLIAQHLTLASEFVEPGHALSPREGEILSLRIDHAGVVGRVETGCLARYKSTPTGRGALIAWRTPLTA
jgi:ribonuclease J